MEGGREKGEKKIGRDGVRDGKREWRREGAKEEGRWLMAVILVLWLLRQEALKFQASLGDNVRSCPPKILKTRIKTKPKV